MHRGVDEELEAVAAAVARHGVLWAESIGLADGAGSWRGQQRLFRADADGDVGAAVELENVPDQVGALWPVLQDGTDSQYFELRRLERQREGESVVNVVADVGIEEDRDGLGGSRDGQNCEEQRDKGFGEHLR